jgi:predicted TIM-barrel fold metal-dependent hydrolase
MILDAYWDPGSDNGFPQIYSPTFRVNAFHFGFSPLADDSDGNNPYSLYPHAFITDLDEYVAWMRGRIAAQKASGCVALKVPLAYDRGLDFSEVPAKQAQRAFARLAALVATLPIKAGQIPANRLFPSNAPGPSQAAGPLPGAHPQDIKTFQDYILFKICETAAELDLPVQIHTGTGQGQRTNALQLDEAIQKNPETRFVLLHCSYPWIQDMGMLVIRYPNIYPDLSMLPLFSSQACKAILHELIEAGAAGKLAWGCDTWTPEESFGSLMAFRHALCTVLAEKVTDGYFSLEDARLVIDGILFNNASNIYRLDSRVNDRRQSTGGEPG